MLNSTLFEQWKQWARGLKSEVIALYFAYSNPRVKWYSRLFIVIVVAYALSPIDLIPDFIPILGYLDDLILVPLGVAIAIKMVPIEVMEEARHKALNIKDKPKNWIAAIIIMICWIVILGWLLFLVF